jgi:hypothetical protein
MALANRRKGPYLYSVMQTLTVRDIAERIRRPSEGITPVIDRLRGWTDIGLLKIVEASDPNPGKGRAREYPEESAVEDAALLTLFAEAGLSPLRFGRMEVDGVSILKLVREATERTKRRRGMAQWLIVWGRPPVSADQLKYEVELQAVKIGKSPKLNKDASWSHALNISVQLKSILTRGET